MDQPDNTPTLVDTFVRVHKVITRALSVTGERGSEFLSQGFPDAGVQQGFTDYVQCLVSVLSAHHMGEDELVFPFFRKRHIVAPFGRLTANHIQIRKLLGQVTDNLAGISEPAPQAALGVVLESFGKVSAIWPSHIDTEETCISGEMISIAISPAEQAQLNADMGKFSQEHAAPSFQVLPFMLFNLDGADRAGLAAWLPRQIVEELIMKEWRPQWAPMQPFLLA
jgi:hemerythrin-like domain-containing protein